MEIPDSYKTPQSIAESAEMIAAGATILKQTLGVVCAAEGILGKPVFTDTERKNVLHHYNKFMRLAHKAYGAYMESYSKALDTKNSKK